MQWRLEFRLTNDTTDTVTTGDTALLACNAMVQTEVSRGITSGPRAAQVTPFETDPNKVRCRSVIPGTDAGHELGTVEKITIYYPDTDYPDDELPCPRILVVTPAERRLLSDLPGAQQSRGISREYLASERIEWAALNQAQAERLAQWWDEALEDGGNWFVAKRWPTPQGVPVHRRWKGALRWGLLPSRPGERMWTVGGECEVMRKPPETA